MRVDFWNRRPTQTALANARAGRGTHPAGSPRGLVALVAAVLALTSLTGFSADPAITVQARQRYPWNGKVDLRFTITGEDGKLYDTSFTAKDMVGGTNITMKTIRKSDGTAAATKEPLLPGTYNWVWDTASDLPDGWKSERVTVTATADGDPHDMVQLWEGGPYWATTNIGAESPEDYGYHFWWGDTVGYKREGDKWVASDGSSSNFSFEEANTPTDGKSPSTLQSEGWVIQENGTYVLAPEHDAAQVQWGGVWRMPTDQEFYDLRSQCDWTWTTTLNGYIVSGRGDYASNSIFLPCVGYGSGTSFYGSDSVGYFWSSVPYSDSYSGSRELCFGSGGHGTFVGGRCYGHSVRPVRSTNTTINYAIRFNANGGTGTMADLPMTCGTAKNLTVNGFSRAGYMFAGWTTSADGSVVYGDGASVNNLTTTQGAVVTLYAKWTLAVVRGKVQLWEGGPYWATTNIGAENPEDYGYYFWWGDTVGYRHEGNAWVASDGSSSNFSFGSSNTPTYNKSPATLQSEGWVVQENGTYILAPGHDAAQMQWGGGWRLPTYQELSDLVSNCDWVWTTTQSGVKGYVVCGKGDYVANSIFLPCAGYVSGTSLSSSGSYGSYWSSVPYSGNYYVCELSFDSGRRFAYYGSRYNGQSVRPVQGFTN